MVMKMKVLLYTEGEKLFSKSGLGKAIKHQMRALEYEGIEYTTNVKDDYDIVHINYYGPNSYALAKKAHKKGKKVVYHAHSTEEDFRNSFIFSKQIAPLFKKWIIKCYSLGDVIITPTPYSKRLLEGYGISKKIYAISNGIELDKFKKNKELRDRFRKEYNIKEDEKVIIGVGLYIERKGILETRRDNLLFAGYVEQKKIVEAMNGCDLYLFPTLEETEGIPIIEACACKTPSLIRDIPVFSEWLEDGVNTYKAKDIDEFENKIKMILNKELPYLGEAAYKVAEERDIQKIGKQLHQVYTEVMKNS